MMLGVVVLAGCAPMPTEHPTAAPTPDVTTEPTSTPSPLATIELGGEDIVFYDAEGAELARLGFDDPPVVVSQLSDAFGDPEIYERTAQEVADGCLSTVYSWGSGDVNLTAWPSNSLLISIEVDELDGVTLESSTGLRVGDDASDVIASLPSEQVDADGVAFSYDPVSETDDGEPFGGVAYHDGSGLVQSLVSPFFAVATDVC
jgi:hypothetical protein